VKANNENKESRVGAFFGLVAGVLVLALTAMAFYALDPPRERHASNWEVSAPEPSIRILPGF
jgi:hypothetical protein